MLFILLVREIYETHSFSDETHSLSKSTEMTSVLTFHHLQVVQCVNARVSNQDKPTKSAKITNPRQLIQGKCISFYTLIHRYFGFIFAKFSSFQDKYFFVLHSVAVK